MTGKAILILTAAGALFSCITLAQNGREGANLPDGPGKAEVQADCTQCHSLNQVTNAGHSKKDWETAVYMMVNAGAKLPADQIPLVTDYLAKNFPEKPQPPAVILPGSN